MCQKSLVNLIRWNCTFFWLLNQMHICSMTHNVRNCDYAEKKKKNRECHHLQGQHFLIHFTFFVFWFQSMIARKMLEFQLRRLGVFDAEETISTHPNFDDSFKICKYHFLINNMVKLLQLLLVALYNFWPSYLGFHQNMKVSNFHGLLFFSYLSISSTFIFSVG